MLETSPEMACEKHTQFPVILKNKVSMTTLPSSASSTTLSVSVTAVGNGLDLGKGLKRTLPSPKFLTKLHELPHDTKEKAWK